VTKEQEDISNKDLADLLQELAKHDNSIIVLSAEEVHYLKEMIEDRKAVTRLWAKIKTFIISAAAVIIAWGTFSDYIKNILKKVVG
jgi:hypothetical protein